MSLNRLQTAPWPAQTPPPVLDDPPPSPKRKRQHARDVRDVTTPSRILQPRQLYEPSEVEAAKSRCMGSGNDVISCFPVANASIPQGSWATFVWNSRRPELTQTNKVNIYLFHGDSRQQVFSWKEEVNPFMEAGWVSVPVNDTWWGERGSSWPGHNMSYPYYWVITRSDKTLDGSEVPQPVFSAVQTTFADSVMSSMSSSSASASAASKSINSRPSASGLQSGASSSPLPQWAIVVIAILAFLALVTLCTLLFLLLARFRALKRSASRNRNSVSSASPMLENVDNIRSPPVTASAGATLAQPPTSSQGHHGPELGDGASTISGTAVDAGPFSGADAAIMADAFRKALRKPDFVGETPEEESDNPEKEELLNKELAEEGRDIRSVGSSRGVKVEQPGDHDAAAPS